MRSNVRSRVCNNWMIDTSILWYYGLILACVKSKIKLCVIREFPWTVSDNHLKPSPSSKGLGNEGSRGFARGLPLLQYSGQVPQPCFRLKGMTSAISTLEYGYWSLSDTIIVRTFGTLCFISLFFATSFVYVLCGHRSCLALRWNYKYSL